MQGAARELFVPLSLAVGFSMIASYLLSSTFVPIVSTWLLRSLECGVSAPLLDEPKESKAAILPAVFAIVQSRASMKSASLDPEDPESAHF